MEAISVYHRLNVCFSVVKQLFLGGEAALFLWWGNCFSMADRLFFFEEGTIPLLVK